MKHFRYLIALMISTGAAFGQDELPGLLWYETYDSNLDEESVALSVKQTPDGGFIYIGSDGLYIEKTDADGISLWTKSYIFTSEDEYLYDQYIQITSDGGFIVSGTFYNSGENAYLAKLDAAGDTLWTRSYRSAAGTSARSRMVVEADGGGYVMVGDIYISGKGSEIWLAKTTASGDTVWTRSYGSAGSNSDRGNAIISVGTGYVVTGEIYSAASSNSVVWIAKFDENGDTVWTNSFDLGGDDGGSSLIQTSDGGFAIISEITELEFGLIKTDANGDSLWSHTYKGSVENGNELIAETADSGFVLLAIDWPTWENPDIILIKTDSDGIEEARVVMGGPAEEYPVSMQMIGDGEFIIAGQAFAEAFLLRMGVGGTPLNPAIVSVSDVPNDQGGRVFVKWQPGFPEEFGSINQYGIFIENGVGEWVSLGSTPATDAEVYTYLAETFRDSNATGNDGSNFIVSAHTITPTVFHQSEIFSGYSVDNLVPATPSTVSASVTTAGVELGWGVPVDADFAHFRVYRDTTAGFDPSANASLADVTDAKFTDTGTVSGTGYYYVISSFDANGNESEYSAEVAVLAVLSVEGGLELPTEFALSQNYPNPFNPTTTVSFDMPVQTEAQLIVYDIMGREVAQLMGGLLAAGYHQVVWAGLDKFGRPVPSGTYIARLVTPKFTKSIKMVLLK